MEWDSEGVQWVEVSEAWGYHFDHNNTQTDIYLPFDNRRQPIKEWGKNKFPI